MGETGDQFCLEEMTGLLCVKYARFNAEETSHLFKTN